MWQKIRGTLLLWFGMLGFIGYAALMSWLFMAIRGTTGLCVSVAGFLLLIAAMVKFFPPDSVDGGEGL